MKQSSISAILVLCSVVFHVSIGFGGNDTEINYILYPIFTAIDCGGVIPLFWNNGDLSAEIEYKYTATFSPNEFCVWTFLAEDTAGEIRLVFHSPMSDVNDGLVVYTWKDFNFTSHKIPGDNSELEIDAQHFAVAFSSDNSAGTKGFAFYVYIQKSAENAISPKAYFSAQNKGEFIYPSAIGQEIYDNDQRVSIVLHGPTETPTRQTREYSLKDLDTEKNHDFVEMYILQPYHFNPLYKFVGRFSGHKSGAVAKSSVMTPFPVLYLFSSDKKVTGKGFTVTWKLVGNGIENNGNSLIRN